MARRSPFRRMKIRLQGLANDFVCVPKKIPTHPLLLLFARSKITQSLIKGIRNGMRLCEPFIPVRCTLHEMPNGQEIVKIGPFLQYKLYVPYEIKKNTDSKDSTFFCKKGKGNAAVKL